MAELEHCYLMWVGKEHYPTIEDYCAEAEKMGVSKRVPNAGVARNLSRPGVAIFLCHDEGETDECLDCLDVVDCYHCAGEDGKPTGLGRRGKTCTYCEGAKTVSGGTGGRVAFEADGELLAEMSYLKYKWLRRQPKKYDDFIESVDDAEPVIEVCEECDGYGRTPRGQVFGVFFPSAVEFVADETKEGDDELKAAAEEAGLETTTVRTVATEPKRGCGKRRRGYYAVTRPAAEAGEDEETRLEALAKRLPDGTPIDVKGDFFRFLSPVEYRGHRFRGVRSWALDPDAEDEAEAIVEAQEAA